MAEEPRGPVVSEREMPETAEEPQGSAVREQELAHEEERISPPPPPPRPPVQTRTSPLALASLATGISAYFIFPIAGAIAAIVTGFLAHNEIRASNGRLTGSAFATAGLVLGWLQIGLIILFAILIGVFAAATPGFQTGLPGFLFGR